MLLGTRDRRRADRAGAARHRPDRAELRHRAGRDERAPALPVAARPRSGCRCMPNAGLPELDRGRRRLPADARTSWPTRMTRSSREYGLAPGRRLLRHHAGAPAPGGRARCGGREPRRARRRGPSPASPRSTSTCRSGRTPSYLSIGERTNANGSKAFREAMLAERLGRLRRDRPGPDPRRRAPARPLRRLRRPRRRRRHARAGRPARHRVDPADHARLHRAGGAARPGWSCSAAAASSTRSTTRTATGPSRGSPGSCRWSREHGAAVVALTIDEEGQARTAEWKVARRRRG